MSTPREVFFESAEYEHRLRRLQQKLHEQNLDLIVTCAPGNICYLNGYVSVNVLDTMFVVVPVEGDPVFYLWQFERGRAESTVVGTETLCWNTDVDPIAFVVNDLKRRGHVKGRIGIDTGSTHTACDIVQQLLTALDGTPVKGVVEDLRLVKSSAEQDYIREAATLTDAGVRAAIQAVSEGVRDHEIDRAAVSALLNANSEFLA